MRKNKVIWGICGLVMSVGILVPETAFGDKAGDISGRVAKIEGEVSQMNERLNHLGDEIMGLRGEITGLRGEMKGMESSLRGEMKGMKSSLRGEIRSNFKWTLAILLSSWITIIGTFVGMFLKVMKKNDRKIDDS